MAGGWGKALSNILLKLEDDALYKATNNLSSKFQNAPDFVKVALKSIQSEYTRGISIDRCLSIILQASKSELSNCVQEIKNALTALKPFSNENFAEALVYITALHKSGKYREACACTEELLLSVPVEDRNKQSRLQVALILTALKVEELIHSDKQFSELLEQWHNLLLELKKEHEERTKLSDFPQSIFFKS